MAKERVAGLTDEQRQLLADLKKLEAAEEAAKPARCPGCGSDQHEHCGTPAHHGGPVNVR